MRRPAEQLPRPLRVAGTALPVFGRARVYVCGITPYDVTHLGHAATFVWADTAVRVLHHLGAQVHVCRNVTDVDDVLTAAAVRAGTPYDRFAALQQFSFDRDMAALGVARPTYEPRAHAYVEEVVALAAALLAADQAYVARGREGATVWFRGAGVPAAAGLDDRRARAALAEFGEDPAEEGRQHPYDVPVWRASRPGEPAWPSPWGPGRPGWHAECTAMALSTFGPALDLHAGGVDLRFPHHAYEAAQAEAATGVRPFARAWMHVGTVLVDEVKMAKSSGNLVLVPDLLERVPAAVVRLLLLDRPWARAWSYTSAQVDDAAARLERLYAAAGRATGSPAPLAAVEDALRDDLDVPGALDLAEEAGGDAARTALGVLALDRPVRP